MGKHTLLKTSIPFEAKPTHKSRDSGQSQSLQGQSLYLSYIEAETAQFSTFCDAFVRLEENLSKQSDSASLQTKFSLPKV
jgi:hypothetical protein